MDLFGVESGAHARIVTSYLGDRRKEGYFDEVAE
jgi:hypothetical protein